MLFFCGGGKAMEKCHMTCGFGNGHHSKRFINDCKPIVTLEFAVQSLRCATRTSRTHHWSETLTNWKREQSRSRESLPVSGNMLLALSLIETGY